MKIEWNKVTWYSKLLAVIVFLVTLIFGIYIGISYEQLMTDAVLPVTTNLDVKQGSPKNIEPTKPVQPYPEAATGYAISYPQCGGNYPQTPYDFGVLGVTKGHSLDPNPCFKSELDWANQAKYPPAFYMNLDFPENISKNLIQSFGCTPQTPECIARHYGYYIAKYAHAYATSQGAEPGIWWLDVQIISQWSGDKNINGQVVLGTIDYFQEQHLPVGLSTTPYQWNQVVGNLTTNQPTWIPGREGKEVAAQYCVSGQSYSGGPVQQLAYIENGFEAVYACGSKQKTDFTEQ